MTISTLLLVSALTMPAPPPPALGDTFHVIVLSTGQHVTVREYRIDGRAIRLTAWDGTPQVLRLDLVDLERSKAATEAEQARLQQEADALVAAEAREAAAKAERDAKRSALDEKTKAQSRGPGSLSAVDVSASAALQMEAKVKDNIAGLTAMCRNAWPNDEEMYGACLSNQADGLNAMAQYAETNLAPLAIQCANEYRPRWDMAAACVRNRQAEFLRSEGAR